MSRVKNTKMENSKTKDSKMKVSQLEMTIINRVNKSGFRHPCKEVREAQERRMVRNNNISAKISCGNKRCYVCSSSRKIHPSHRRRAPEFRLQVDDISARSLQHEKEITPPTEAAQSTFPECIIIGSTPQYRKESYKSLEMEGNLGNPGPATVASDVQEHLNGILPIQEPIDEQIVAAPDIPSSTVSATAQGAQEHLGGGSTDQDQYAENHATATDNFSTAAAQGGDSNIQDASSDHPAVVAENLSNKFAEHQDAFNAIQADNHYALPHYDLHGDIIIEPDGFDHRLDIPPGYEYAAPRSLPFEAMNMDAPLPEPAPSLHESETPRIQAFAKLEFDDRPFYMNTYSIVLGRDIQAARKAAQRIAEIPRGLDGKIEKQSSGSSQGYKAKASSSLISDGGAVDGGESHGVSPKKKKRSKKSKSTSSSSHFLSRNDSITVHPSVTTNDHSMITNSMGSPEAGVRPVDPASLLPSPDECPLVPLHPPATGPGEPSSHKGISRRHAKIGYNFDKHFFEMSILGINGAFVDEVWYAAGDIITLKNGSYIQIGNASMTFMLPDVPPGATGAEELEGTDPPHGGKMSFEFENSRGEGIPLGTSSSGGYDSSEDGADEDDDEESSDTGTEEGDGEQRRGKGENYARVSGPRNVRVDAVDEEDEEIEPEPILEPSPVKRKGPGRPPKNGYMSKREQALRAREAKLAAKQTAATQPPANPPNTKGKKASKTKTPSPTPPETDPPKKRAYKKRQPKAAEDQPQPSIEPKSASEGAIEQEPKEIKPPKEKKPVRAPKSPSPVFDVSKLTAEDLAKPQASYVILIYDALSATGVPMSLSQIYHAIARKFPYYSVKVTTKGWESSVRHNLSQHSAFIKVAKDGKGYLWGINPGVSIEKEKKKRMSPPAPPPSQPYLQQQPVMGHPPHYSSIPPPPPGASQPYIPAPQHSMPPPIPHGLPLANVPVAQPTPPMNGYTSPYAPPPPPTAPTVVPQTQSQFSRPSTTPTPVPQRPPQPSLSSSHNGANGFYANTTRFQPPTYPTHSASPVLHNNNQQIPTVPRPTPPPANHSQPPQPPQPPSIPRIQNSKASADVLQAFSKFKVAFVNQMGDKARGEAIVSSAINRTLGLSTKSSVPGPEDPSEAVVLKTLQGMLGGLGKKNEASKPNSQQHQPASQQQQNQQQQQQNQARQTPAPPAQQQQTQIQQQLQQLMNLQTHQQQNNPSSATTQSRTSQAQLLQLLAQVGREKEKRDFANRTNQLQGNNNNSVNNSNTSNTSTPLNNTPSNPPPPPSAAKPNNPPQTPLIPQLNNPPQTPFIPHTPHPPPLPSSSSSSPPTIINGNIRDETKIDEVKKSGGSGVKRVRVGSFDEGEGGKRVRG